MGVPVPGELALLTAGAFAGQGDISLIGVIISSSIGTIIGGSGGYWLGRTGGLSLIERYGHLIGIDDKKLGDARSYFVSHGAKTIILSRFIAILRIMAGLMAGVVHMSFGLFTVCNAIGGIIWSVAFALLGDVFGSNLPLLEHYVHRIGLATVIMVALVLAAFLVWRRRRPPSM
jgi:membrane protein DedA with SNARE-associated domain